jgi:hypothetical protein
MPSARLPFPVRLAQLRGDVPSIRVLSNLAEVERTRLSRALYGEVQLDADERARVVAVIGYDPWRDSLSSSVTAAATAATEFADNRAILQTLKPTRDARG